MPQLKWLITLCLSPVAALVFSVAICATLIVSWTVELHQHMWQSR